MFDEVEGKQQKLHYTVEDGFWVEYHDILPSPEELQEQRIQDLEMAIGAILGGAM